jgi:hypothetical protein
VRPAGRRRLAVVGTTIPLRIDPVALRPPRPEAVSGRDRAGAGASWRRAGGRWLTWSPPRAASMAIGPAPPAHQNHAAHCSAHTAPCLRRMKTPQKCRSKSRQRADIAPPWGIRSADCGQCFSLRNEGERVTPPGRNCDDPPFESAGRWHGHLTAHRVGLQDGAQADHRRLTDS